MNMSIGIYKLLCSEFQVIYCVDTSIWYERTLDNDNLLITPHLATDMVIITNLPFTAIYGTRRVIYQTTGFQLFTQNVCIIYSSELCSIYMILLKVGEMALF